MEQKFQESAAKLLASAQGRELMQTLTAIPRDARREMQEALAAGDTQRAKALLAPWLSDARTKELLSALSGGGMLG